MALQATLELEGKKYNVTDLDYRISQPVDHKGKPTGIPEIGQVNFTILSQKKDNDVFHKWAISLANAKSGEFKLPVTDGVDHDTTSLKFENAFLTDLHVYYSSYSDKQIYMKISISARKLIFSQGAEYDNVCLGR